MHLRYTSTTYKMTTVPLIFLLTWTAILINENSLVNAQNQCNVNADCFNTNMVCCREYFNSRRKSCQFLSCVGHYCLTHGDCGGKGECCIANKCVNYGCTVSQCFSNLNCPVSQYCCNRGFLSNVCRQSCVGETCLSNSGCGGPGEHCDSNFKCSTSTTTNSSSLAGWVIGIIITGKYYIIQ